MNFVVKQALKSKTGGITDKLDEVTKKCKDIMDSDSDVKTTTVQTLSKEEQIKQEIVRKQEHYAAINEDRELQRNKLREKYGLNTGGGGSSVQESEAVMEKEEAESKKDCCLM